MPLLFARCRGGGDKEVAKSPPYVLRSTPDTEDANTDELRMRRTARARAVAAWIAQRDACANNQNVRTEKCQPKKHAVLSRSGHSSDGKSNGYSSRPLRLNNANSDHRGGTDGDTERDIKGGCTHNSNGNFRSPTLPANNNSSSQVFDFSIAPTDLSTSALPTVPNATTGNDTDNFWGAWSQTASGGILGDETKDNPSRENGTATLEETSYTDAVIKADRPSPILPAPIHRPVAIKLSNPMAQPLSTAAGCLRRCVVLQDFAADKRVPHTVDVLRGEIVTVLNRANGWAYVETADGYAGYIPDHFCQEIHSPGHGLRERTVPYQGLNSRFGHSVAGHLLLERSRSATPSMRRSAFREVHDRLKRCSSSSPTFGGESSLRARLTRRPLPGTAVRSLPRQTNQLPSAENSRASRETHCSTSSAAGYESGSSSGIESDAEQVAMDLSPMLAAGNAVHVSMVGSQASLTEIGADVPVHRKRKGKKACHSSGQDGKGADERSVLSADSDAFALSPPDCPSGRLSQVDDNRYSAASSGISVSTVFNKQLTRKVVMLFPFKARAENDLSAARGDCLTVLNDEDPDWLWVGNRLDAQGFVPRSFVQELTSSLFRCGRKNELLEQEARPPSAASPISQV